MLAAYIDESFDPNNEGVYAVAGVIADTSDWFDIERSWESQGSRTAKARKMSESKRKKYLDSISDQPIFVVGAVVIQSEFYRTFQKSGKA